MQYADQVLLIDFVINNTENFFQINLFELIKLNVI